MNSQKQIRFMSYIDKAINNKFTKSVSICSFYLICPKNGQPTVITYNGKRVGTIENGKIILSEFNGQTWKGFEFKYEFLVELEAKYNPPVKKRRYVKSKSTKN